MSRTTRSPEPRAPSALPKIAAYGFGGLLLIGIVVAHPLLSTASAMLLVKVSLECQRRGAKTFEARFGVAVSVLGAVTRAVFRPLRGPYVSITRWAFSKYAEAHVKRFRDPPKTATEKIKFREEKEGGLRTNENGALPAFVFTACGRYEALPVVSAEESPTDLGEYATPEDIIILAENEVFAPKPKPKTRGKKRKSREEGEGE